MFERLWGWAEATLFIREDGLAAWMWNPKAGRVTDIDDASDGNILIAWALAEAGYRWKEPKFTDSARKISEAAALRDTVRTRYGNTWLPGSRAFRASDREDGPIVNLSYWVFPAFSWLRRLSPARDWDGIFASGVRLIEAVKFGPDRLPSDWISLSGKEPKPAAGFRKVFGYDAIRVPLYLAWARPQSVKVLADLHAYLGDAPYQAPSVVDVESGDRLQQLGGDGYKAVAAAVDCLLNRASIPPSFMKVKRDYYYPTTLQILSLIAVQERRPECFPPSNQSLGRH
jgi:endoglucanase